MIFIKDLQLHNNEAASFFLIFLWSFAFFFVPLPRDTLIMCAQTLYQRHLKSRIIIYEFNR